MAYNKSSKRKSKYAIGAPKGKTPSRSCNLRKGFFFAPSGLPKPLPLGEVALRSNDGEGKPVSKEHLHSDKHWLLIESSYRCVFVLSQRPCPLRRSAPAPPKGEPLAERKTLNWKGKLCGLPKPPLGRGGGSASALTERLDRGRACKLSVQRLTFAGNRIY